MIMSKNKVNNTSSNNLNKKQINHNNNTNNHIIEGSIGKAILTIGIPVILSNLLHTFFNLVDTYWVGKLGADAIAAVSSSFPIIFLLISIGSGLAIAGTILLAQYKGKGNQEKIDSIATQTFLVMTIISVLISIAGILLTAPIMKLMGISGEVLLLGTKYLRIIFMGMFFQFSYFVFQSLMRSVGDVKTPLYIVFGAVVLNFFLDPMLIHGVWIFPKMGIAGAAIATIVTQGLAAMFGIFLLFSGKYGIHLQKKYIKIDLKQIKEFFKLGLPATINQSLNSILFIFMTALAAKEGVIILAAYGIGVRIFSFIIIPSFGLATANQTLVGQNIGAGKINRATKISWITTMWGFVILTLIGIIMFFTAENIVSTFISNNQAVVESGAQFIRIMALTFGFVAGHIILNSTFNASGNTNTSMFTSIFTFWIVRYPVALILIKIFSLQELGIYISFTISNIAGFFCALVIFLNGKWKKTKITEEIKMQEKVLNEMITDEGFEN